MREGSAIYPPAFSLDWREGTREEDNWLHEYIETHEIVSFGVGDGLAWYMVEGNTMHPILISDEHEIPAAYIRGLTRAEVDELIQSQRNLAWR